MSRDINPFGIRMPLELREQLEVAARKAGRSMNAHLVHVLQEYVFMPDMDIVQLEPTPEQIAEANSPAGLLKRIEALHEQIRAMHSRLGELHGRLAAFTPADIIRAQMKSRVTSLEFSGYRDDGKPVIAASRVGKGKLVTAKPKGTKPTIASAVEGAASSVMSMLNEHRRLELAAVRREIDVLVHLLHESSETGSTVDLESVRETLRGLRVLENDINLLVQDYVDHITPKRESTDSEASKEVVETAQKGSKKR